MLTAIINHMHISALHGASQPADLIRRKKTEPRKSQEMEENALTQSLSFSVNVGGGKIILKY